MGTTETNYQKVRNENSDTKRIVAFPARLMPLHNGHKEVLLGLAKDFDKVVIVLGSVFETGTERNCILASEREKAVDAIFKRAEILPEKYETIGLADVPTFEEWISRITTLCKSRGVTHFCTGNKEDILDVLEQKGQVLEFETVNPEDYTDFPYHATDIRKMILEGKYQELCKLIPQETMPILFRNSFREIIAASQNRGINFIQGRQTVDLIFLIRDIFDGKIYVLLGKRSMEKEDFPGYLALPGGGIDEEKGETAYDAVIREFHEETGLQLEMLDNSVEPAIVRFANVPKSNLEQMFIVGLYSSEDEKVAGTKGGSSQCFGVFVEDDIHKYQEYLNPTDDLTDVKFYEIDDAVSKGLAYQHETMIQKAVQMFNAYPDLRKVLDTEKEETDTFVIAFVGAPGAGKSTASFGTSYQFKTRGVSMEYVPEVAKDLLYRGLLGKYIPNQAYIVSEQYKKLYDVMGQVDYIVTDAGLEICALHSANEAKEVEDLAWYLRNKLNQFTIFIERDEKQVQYETNGRKESEAESRVFGKKLEKYLQDNGAKYQKVIGTDAAIELALKILEDHKTRKN